MNLKATAMTILLTLSLATPSLAAPAGPDHSSDRSPRPYPCDNYDDCRTKYKDGKHSARKYPDGVEFYCLEGYSKEYEESLPLLGCIRRIIGPEGLGDKSRLLEQTGKLLGLGKNSQLLQSIGKLLGSGESAGDGGNMGGGSVGKLPGRN